MLIKAYNQMREKKLYLSSVKTINRKRVGSRRNENPLCLGELEDSI